MKRMMVYQAREVRLKKLKKKKRKGEQFVKAY